MYTCKIITLLSVVGNDIVRLRDLIMLPHVLDYYFIYFTAILLH